MIYNILYHIYIFMDFYVFCDFYGLIEIDNSPQISFSF